MSAAAPAKESNNFGALRLLLAYLVILSHSPELVDGNRSREILTRIFGTVSFGELAVNFFFIISGYLITASFRASSSGLEYMAKRVLRIYPGFIVAFLVCVFLLGPWGGGVWGAYAHGSLKDSMLVNLLLLAPPASNGAFAGTHYPYLNGAVWTIRYEFLMYLLVLVAGLAGLLARRRVVLGAVAFALLLFPMLADGVSYGLPAALEGWVTRLETPIRFFGMFGCGTLFYLYRDRIVYAPRRALAAALVLFAAMFFDTTAQLAIATLGGYLTFYFAFHYRNRHVARIGTKNDLSYGAYLYAWPIQALLVWSYPGMSPWLLFMISLVGATACAYVSWVAVERPALRLKTILMAIGKDTKTTSTGAAAMTRSHNFN